MHSAARGLAAAMQKTLVIADVLMHRSSHLKELVQDSKLSYARLLPLTTAYTRRSHLQAWWTDARP